MAAPVTSDQSKVIVWPASNCASFAGEMSVGAASVPVEAGLTVRLAVRLTPPAVAVIVTVVCAVTDVVVAVNVALVAPAAMVTLAGTAADVLELASETETPPLGAALVRVTVPVEDEPPATLVGERLTVERLAGGFTVSVAVRLTLLHALVRVTAV